jgi:transposase
LIEQAYKIGETLGLATWNTDQAGPFRTVPYQGSHWRPQGRPEHQPHEYIRNGTAKLLTLFHGADGQVRVKGVTTCPNTVLHPWLRQELMDILASLPEPAPVSDPQANRSRWEMWFEGLSVRPNLPTALPAPRLLLILDNLKGHKSSELVSWFYSQGIIPLYTPLGGSWLNMAESMQRILKRRALDGQHPTSPTQIIDWLEAAARGWNRNPTPFEWGGKRARRRARSRERRYALGGSGACTRRPIRPNKTILAKWQATCQATH